MYLCSKEYQYSVKKDHQLNQKLVELSLVNFHIIRILSCFKHLFYFYPDNRLAITCKILFWFGGIVSVESIFENVTYFAVIIDKSTNITTLHFYIFEKFRPLLI